MIKFLHGWLLLVTFSVCGMMVAAETPAKNYFNVRDFGAVGDGMNLDSPAIDRAIAAAAQGGGGTFLIPSGSYLSGSIHLQSNIHLLLDAGCDHIRCTAGDECL